jgi:hypothetical protein
MVSSYLVFMQLLPDVPTPHFIILGAACGAGCYKSRAPPLGGELLCTSHSGV